jgi:hypothetical protein
MTKHFETVNLQHKQKIRYKIHFRKSHKCELRKGIMLKQLSVFDVEQTNHNRNGVKLYDDYALNFLVYAN